MRAFHQLYKHVGRVKVIGEDTEQIPPFVTIKHNLEYKYRDLAGDRS